MNDIFSPFMHMEAGQNRRQRLAPECTMNRVKENSLWGEAKLTVFFPKVLTLLCN